MAELPSHSRIVIVGGGIVGAWAGGVALTIGDVYEAIGRGLLNGAGIAAASCVSGLIARRTATEVPRAVSRAMMRSSVVVIGVAALGITLRVLG